MIYIHNFKSFSVTKSSFASQTLQNLSEKRVKLLKDDSNSNSNNDLGFELEHKLKLLFYSSNSNPRILEFEFFDLSRSSSNNSRLRYRSLFSNLHYRLGLCYTGAVAPGASYPSCPKGLPNPSAPVCVMTPLSHPNLPLITIVFARCHSSIFGARS